MGIFVQRSANFWYRETYTCVVLTFGFVLFGEYSAGRLPLGRPALLLQDTSVQYLFCALLWLFTAPFVGTLPPFMIFSFSHVLNFACTDLLPSFGHPLKSPLNIKIENFVSSNSTQFMLAAANIEFLVLVRLVFLVLTFRKSAIIQFIFFVLFFKLRYQTSAYTHRIVQTWEIRVDSLVSHPSLPPVVKNVWIQLKGYIRLVFGSILGGPMTSSHATSTGEKKHQ